MTLKRKLFTAVSMFALTCAMLLVGVWAVSSTSIEVGGTISFQATSVNAEVTGAFSGASTNPTLNKLTYTSTTSPSTADLNTWKNNVTFAENGGDITLTINVTNKSSERAMYVSIEDTAEDVATLTKTIKQGANDYTEGNAVKVAASATVTFTVTFHLTNTDVSTEATYAYTVTLKDESEHVELKHDTDNDYYYVEMGNYQGTAVRWRVVGVKNTETNEVEAYTYNESQAPTGELTFILETLTTNCPFGYYDYYYDENDMTQENLNSDYSTSVVRQYLTGHDCALDYAGNDMAVTRNYLDEIQISENNAVYKQIKGRTMTDLYQDIDIKIADPMVISDGTPATTVGTDKLWLPSAKEMFLLVAKRNMSEIVDRNVWNGEEVLNSFKWGDGDYWLRGRDNPDGYPGKISGTIGFIGNAYNNEDHFVRPMFVLEF